MTTTNPDARRGVTLQTAALAVVVSLIAAATAVALFHFAHVTQTAIVIGTIIAASIVGWTQPAARLKPVPVRARRTHR